MAFPRPRPARPELPRQRVQTLQCGQGAVRAARFNGETGEKSREETGGNGGRDQDPGMEAGNQAGVPVWGFQGSRPFPPAADGNYCLTCGSDKTLKLWNPHKGTALRTYQGHGYEVLDAAG